MGEEYLHLFRGGKKTGGEVITEQAILVLKFSLAFKRATVEI